MYIYRHELIIYIYHILTSVHATFSMQFLCCKINVLMLKIRFDCERLQESEVNLEEGERNLI